MRSFRIRLILALIAGITAVSLASTYFEVLAHKHVLRRELSRHTIATAALTNIPKLMPQIVQMEAKASLRGPGPLNAITNAVPPIER